MIGRGREEKGVLGEGGEVGGIDWEEEEDRNRREERNRRGL